MKSNANAFIFPKEIMWIEIYVLVVLFEIRKSVKEHFD